jgi:hypothetical protein
MYTRATSLPNLYIRNIIPDGMGIPLPEHLAYRGGAQRKILNSDYALSPSS